MGAGRKSKAEELRLSAIMDDIGNTEKVLKNLYNSACKPGNVAAAQLWLAYKFGKPKENEGQPQEISITGFKIAAASGKRATGK